MVSSLVVLITSVIFCHDLMHYLAQGLNSLFLSSLLLPSELQLCMAVKNLNECKREASLSSELTLGRYWPSFDVTWLYLSLWRGGSGLSAHAPPCSLCLDWHLTCISCIRLLLALEWFTSSLSPVRTHRYYGFIHMYTPIFIKNTANG